MNKVLIYPYDITNLHFIQYSGEDNDNIIVSVVSPRGWGYDGEDAGKKIGVTTDIIVENDLIGNLEKVDTLIFVDSILELDDAHIEWCIKNACLMNKRIIILRDVNQNITDKYNGILDLYNRNEKFNVNKKKKELLIKEIDKPIVLVIGSGERCGKFDVQLLIRNIFINNGYSVTQIGSKKDSEYYGFHSIPQAMFENEISDTEKVYFFNQYIANLCNTENSDVIVIGVPGGVCPYDTRYHNNFGVLNYLISNAIIPDYVVYNSVYCDYPEKYLAEIREMIKYRFGYTVDAVFISNFYINRDATNDFRKLVYMTLDNKFVHNTCSKISAFSVFDKKDRENFEKEILETLRGYQEYTMI